MRLRLALPLVLAALAVTSTSGHAATPKACDYITTQLASTTFGAALKPGKEAAISDIATECTFADDFNGSLMFDISNLADIATSMGATTAQIMPIVTQHEAGTEAIPGLGEWNSYNTDGHDLKVVFHGKLLTLNVSESKNPAIKAALVAAMRQIMLKV